jgi:hypothetical protein
VALLALRELRFGATTVSVRGEAVVLGAVALLQPLGTLAARKDGTGRGEGDHQQHDDDDQNDHGGFHRAPLCVAGGTPERVNRGTEIPATA